ncbi:hypothetical protein TcCL_Unassigned00187 [Trypanosoma cruzi]|nr:hypothetical protein TcCL_Unassigned00187 [Trypanosoma cruzi]
MKDIKPTEKPRLRAGECHRETVHRVPKMASTHALINVTLSPVSTKAEASGRGEGARFAATTDQWDHHRLSFAVQHACFSATAMPDRPATARRATALTGNCENRPI